MIQSSPRLAIRRSALPAAGALLKQTSTRCPVCRQPCPGEVWKRGPGDGKIFLERTCPAHGFFSVCISSSGRFYWLSRGAGESACCGESSGDPGGDACAASDLRPVAPLGRNARLAADPTCEILSSCLVLIEIVDSCNLKCPTCYADSPYTSPAAPNGHSLQALQERIEGVVARKGHIEILQLSGGEPTLHPDFFRLAEWIQSHPSIDYLLINTNGVRLATDPLFAEQMAEVSRRRRVQIYLQFDGIGIEGQLGLRGGDLREVRHRALDVCKKIKLPVTLAMTVTPENLGQLWTTVEFALSRDEIRGVTFQPLFGSGRLSVAARPPAFDPLNAADVIMGLITQSGGRLGPEDFTPLPCGDPNCATIGYLLKTLAGVRSISEFIDFRRLQGFLRDRVRYSLADLKRCGCESEPLGALLHELEIDERKTFRLFIKPFMDALTWDQDRIDRCCTHVIRPDGKLDSFCRYYSRFPGTQPGSALNGTPA